MCHVKDDKYRLEVTWGGGGGGGGGGGLLLTVSIKSKHLDTLDKR